MLQKTLLRLAFTDRLTYCRNQGYRTPKMSIPFKVLADICNRERKMVRKECQSLNSLVKVFSEWNELIEAEDIDFDSLPSPENGLPKTSMGVPSP